MLQLLSSLIEIPCFVNGFALRQKGRGDHLGLALVIGFQHSLRQLANCLFVRVRLDRRLLRIRSRRGGKPRTDQETGENGVKISQGAALLQNEEKETNSLSAF